MRPGTRSPGGWSARHPRVAVALSLLILVALGAFCARELAERRDSLPNGFAARVMVGVAWLVAWGALWMIAYGSLKRSHRRRDRRRNVGRTIGWIVGTAVFIAWLVVAQMTFSRFGPDPIDSIPPEDAVPRLTFLLGSVLVAMGLGITVLIRRDDLRSHSPALVDHDAVVLDVRPQAGDDFEPYFAGQCSCGWVGPVRDDVKGAIADVSRHRPDRDPDVVRPLA